MRCAALLGTLVTLTAAGCKQRAEWERGKKVLHLALRSKVGSLDPVRSSTQYNGMAQSLLYEPLLTYKYLVRPFELEPLLLARMPDISADGRVYNFELKPETRFHDDPCFETTGGTGREVTARDVFYSFKRMADQDLRPEGWWIFQDRIVGFDDFQARMNQREEGEPFDWDADIAGFVELDRYRFQIELLRPFPQFLNILAMTYTSVVPRECAEYYGPDFSGRAVGTGPFRFSSWSRGNRIVVERNPTFRADFYPSEASSEARELGLLGPAGQRVPFVDAVVWHVFEHQQPAWLKFRVGDIDMVMTPAEYYDAAFDADRKLRDHFVADGIRSYNLPLLDLVYRGFNMQDPVVGGYDDRGRFLRCAISAAADSAEINDAFYNGTNVLYDGPIPPGLDAYRPGVTSPYRGSNLELARDLLARAGYPGGQGLPELVYETSIGGNNQEQSEMFTRQLKEIGVRIRTNISSFPELSDKLKRKKAQMFGLAWNADYPDAENFLQLFYGPNQAPGSNNFNYDKPEYNALFRTARAMAPSPERTELYLQMREILIGDCPMFGSMARTRFYVWHDRLKNVYPAEVWYRWVKYLDLEEPYR